MSALGSVESVVKQEEHVLEAFAAAPAAPVAQRHSPAAATRAGTRQGDKVKPDKSDSHDPRVPDARQTHARKQVPASVRSLVLRSAHRSACARIF